jgi:hypothetical protein
MFAFDKDGKRKEIWRGSFPSGTPHRYSADPPAQDESSIPLLLDAMLDTKLQDEVTAARPESDASSSDAVYVYEQTKVPWWSYIWVSRGWNPRPMLSLTSPRIMTQREPIRSENLSRGSTSHS